jgi:hypothetical protein
MSVPPLYQSTGGGPITGIAIDVDAFAPIGPTPYKYIRLTGGGSAEVDSIEVLP